MRKKNKKGANTLNKQIGIDIRQSHKEDRKQTDPLAKSGVPVMDKEWLLSGLLKYKLDRKLKL